ncbi:MAG: hypothetical protein KAS47_09190, partial [Candidatus Heimdallarchaeota archaeon]|nr:hypothetical protein [Candidatus Heimdallarchaeota archaeon]
EVILSLVSENINKNYTMADLKALPSVSGLGGYKKTTGTLVGPSTYKGVPIISLLDDIGGMLPTSDLIIRATDGYVISFSYSMIVGQVTAYDNETGANLGINEFEMIVAYEQDGNALATDDGSLRIAYLSDEGYLSDGNLWAKKIQEIEIKSVTESWIVYLYGITNDSVNRPFFESVMASGETHTIAFYEMHDGDRIHSYTGIPLWTIISIIDGELEDSTSYTFNETFALNGYDIILKNSDEEIITLNSSIISHNDDILLAVKKNSLFLPLNEAPLRLVGDALNYIQMIGKIVEIWIVF